MLILERPNTVWTGKKLRQQYGMRPIAAYTGAAGTIEVVNGIPLTVSSGAGRTVTHYGSALGHTATSSNASCTPKNLTAVTDNPLTLLWRGVFVGNISGSSPGIGGLQAASQDSYHIGVGRNSDTQMVVYSRATSTSMARALAFDPSVHYGKAMSMLLRTTIVSLNNDLLDLFVLVDGQVTKYSSTAITSLRLTSRTLTGNEVFSSGADTAENATRNPNIQTSFLGVFSGAPNDGVAAQILFDPSSFFAPQQIYIPTAAAAASGLPTLSIPTFVPGSITATGARGRVTATAP